jgi:hypothetical protein
MTFHFDEKVTSIEVRQTAGSSPQKTAGFLTSTPPCWDPKDHDHVASIQAHPLTHTPGGSVALDLQINKMSTLSHNEQPQKCLTFGSSHCVFLLKE